MAAHEPVRVKMFGKTQARVYTHLQKQMQREDQLKADVASCSAQPETGGLCLCCICPPRESQSPGAEQSGMKVMAHLTKQHAQHRSAGWGKSGDNYTPK